MSNLNYFYAYVERLLPMSRVVGVNVREPPRRPNWRADFENPSSPPKKKKNSSRRSRFDSDFRFLVLRSENNSELQNAPWFPRDSTATAVHYGPQTRFKESATGFACGQKKAIHLDSGPCSIASRFVIRSCGLRAIRTGLAHGGDNATITTADSR